METNGSLGSAGRGLTAWFGESQRLWRNLLSVPDVVTAARDVRVGTTPSTVLLEERIAVGDPACRVVVSLVPVPEDEAPFAHLYRAPAGSTTDTG